MGKVLLGQTFIVLKRNAKDEHSAPVFLFNTLVREKFSSQNKFKVV